MTSREAMIYQLQQLKGKPLKYKIQHIFTYYWIPLLVALIILILGISYIVSIVTTKESALNVVCLCPHVDRTAATTYAEEFAIASGIDLDEYEVSITTDLSIASVDMMGTYQTAQVLAAQVAAQTVDMIVGDIETMNQYFYQNLLLDVRILLTQEQQEKYAPFFLYMDMATLRQTNEIVNSIPEYPDPTNPDTMVDPVPVALILSEGSDFNSICSPYQEQTVVITLVANSQNTSNAQVFLDYIME